MYNITSYFYCYSSDTDLCVSWNVLGMYVEVLGTTLCKHSGIVEGRERWVNCSLASFFKLLYTYILTLLSTINFEISFSRIDFRTVSHASSLNFLPNTSSMCLGHW